jgi:hypothetical protein
VQDENCIIILVNELLAHQDVSNQKKNACYAHNASCPFLCHEGI